MLNYDFVFEKAWYLLLLVPLLPAVWWLSRGSLAGLSRWRRWMAVGLRMAVIMLVVGALAGMQLEKRTNRITVIYLLDQSLSVPQDQRQAMLQYVNEAVRRHHEQSNEDKVGVIVFGRDAAVEYPPADYFAGLAQVETTDLDPEHTDLSGAMKRAMAMFTGDYAKRIVVVSDGNENLGDARRQARSLADASVSIDVMPVYLPLRNEISVEKVAIPSDVRRDQPFDLRVVMNNETAGTSAGRTVRGKLRITRKTGEQDDIIAEQDVELPPGKRVFRIPEEIDRADFFTYEAVFVPDDPAQDGTSQNNSATAFTHVRGQGRVLLIEDFAEPNQFLHLVDSLRREGLEVTVQPSNQLFTSLPELQRYDVVILANVPRSSGESTEGEGIANFSDEQISMLVRNTEMGCGLIMVGGPNSFGAGGWTNTDLEKAMPIDFQIKSKQVAPVGALVLMMHAGEIPQANYWQKRIAVESVKALGYQDYCGLVQWNGTDQWLWAASQGGMLPVGPNRQRMLSRVDRMNIGDMPAFDPAMNMAAAAFAKLDSGPEKPAVKHMIIISDGDPSPPTGAVLGRMVSLGVKISTVAVGSHGILGSNVMQNISTQTGGKYYEVKSSNALPRIYQREVRRVAQPLIYEKTYDIGIQQRMQHEMTKGIEGVPPVRGFVMTTVKEGALPEILLTATEPMEKNATILAGWQYGYGKAVAFTSDAGRQWANVWTGWEGYDRFFSQVVRWAMRPLGDTGKYSLSTSVEQGRTQVIVTALDQEDEFLNYQSMSGLVVTPGMQMEELKFRQVAPGRYMAEFASESPGSYSVSVNPGVGQGQLLTGVNVGYSSEYQDRQTNLPLLEAMSSLQAKGGEPGKLLRDDPTTVATDERLDVDPFRRDLPEATSIQDVWPLLVFVGSILFFADVFVRRVQVGFEWLGPVAARARDFVLRRQPQAPVEETMSRLKSRKDEVGQQIAHRRATARFEAEPEAPVDPSVLDQARQASSRPEARPTQAGPAKAEPEEEDTYTSRLLKAKKDVWKGRGN
jgi:uncharacterized membrane protein